MIRIGELLIDVECIEAVCPYQDGVLILFKSGNSKLVGAENMSMSRTEFVEKIEKQSNKSSLMDKFLLMMALQNNQNK